MLERAQAGESDACLQQRPLCLSGMQGPDGLEEAKCPSCMVALGNATSVLASRVIQRVTHECEHDGCEEKIPFAHLEKHRLACLFRKVLCPDCRIEKTVHEVAQHIQFCVSNSSAHTNKGYLDFGQFKEVCTFMGLF